MNNEIGRAHEMIDRLRNELGSLDNLYFAFPQVRSWWESDFGDSSVYVMGAISRYRNPPDGAVITRVGDAHPMPSGYVKLDGIARVEIGITSKAAKKLLRAKHCLVIEEWKPRAGGISRFVCRVPNAVRDGLEKKTLAIAGIPPEGHDWSLGVMKQLQETAREMHRQKSEASKRGWA